MSRSALAVLVALLLAGAAVGSVVALPSPNAQTDGNAVAMLTIDSPSRSAQATQSLDVSRAVGLQRDAAASRLEQYAFEARLEGVENDTVARRLIANELERVDERIDELRDEEQSLRRDFAEREIGSATYLYGLARIDARTERLHQRLGTLRTHAVERGVDAERVGDVEGKLAGLRGPVRDRLRAAIVGERRQIRVDASASPNGTALSMIEGGTHVREAYREDHRTTLVWGTIPPDELFGPFTNQLVSEVYGLEPLGTDVWEGIDRGPGASRGRGVGRGLYVAIIEARHLTITVHIDGDTRDIFSEVQERPLDRLPPREAVTAVDNGTRLVVNRTYGGGPLRIATYDNSTGLPTSTVVDVAGNRYETGPEGVVWVLAPHRFKFPVTAMTSEGNVTVEVTTLRSSPVSGET